jgi:predicted SprT family Zn-dependent metalloprotease
MNLLQLDFFESLLKVFQPETTPESAVCVEETAARPERISAPLLRHGDDPELLAKCRELLAPHGCLALAERVRVRWNARMRSTAGLARIEASLITLNPRLLEFGEEEIDRTLRHELAHLLAHFRAGRRRIAAHGREWRKACADLGVPGEARCHDLPLPRREQARRHIYVCPVCRKEVRRTRPFRRPSACLSCCRKFNRGRYDKRFKFVKVAV